MKIVVEGVVYDHDLAGKIKVIDRDDIVNTAKLSRSYTVKFSLVQTTSGKLNPTAAIVLEAGLENLAAELLNTSEATSQAGCRVDILFRVAHKNDPRVFKLIRKVIEGTWGENRRVTQVVSFDPLGDHSIIENKVSVSFDRLILEEQIDDLTEMVNYMVRSLEQLIQIDR
nr:hypothetical protein [Mesobacillus harenae]